MAVAATSVKLSNTDCSSASSSEIVVVAVSDVFLEGAAAGTSISVCWARLVFRNVKARRGDDAVFVEDDPNVEDEVEDGEDGMLPAARLLRWINNVCG